MRLALKIVAGILLLCSFTVSGFGAPKAPQGDPAKGEEVFKNFCSSCHVLGGKLIGPNLVGVKDRWPDYNKLVDFVQHPANYIDKDPYIIKLQKEYNSIMAVGAITSQQAADVVEYAHAGGAGGGAEASGGAALTFMPVPANPAGVRYLFVGVVVMLLVVAYLAYRLRGASEKVDDSTPDINDRPARKISGLAKFNAFLAPIFLIVGGFLLYYDLNTHIPYLRPEAATDIGKEIDRLFHNTFILTAIVFVVTQILLFYYIFKYRARPGRKAYFFSHNNTLEYVWTIIPAVVLSFLVLDGFRVWQRANDNPANNPVSIEVFAKQFDWTIRYPGPDGKLGKADFRLISSSNPLGLDFNDPAAKDDYIVTDALHLPKDRDVYLKLRSQDVTHAAWFPHFRMQMYANPGMDNRLRFKPTISTEEMRKKTGNPKFNYELACNQLCGGGHWNMRRVVSVVTQQEYNEWASDMTKHKPAFEAYTAANATAQKSDTKIEVKQATDSTATSYNTGGKTAGSR